MSEAKVRRSWRQTILETQSGSIALPCITAGGFGPVIDRKPFRLPWTKTAPGERKAAEHRGAVQKARGRGIIERT